MEKHEGGYVKHTSWKIDSALGWDLPDSELMLLIPLSPVLLTARLMELSGDPLC